MTALEKQFDEVYVKYCKQAEKACACKLTRMMQQVEKFGGIKTAKEIIRKGRLSDDFEKLAAARQIKLTLEALVVESAYSELFTDDEVNACYEVLCEYGYY